MAFVDWQNPDVELIEMVDDLRQRCLDVYRNDPLRVQEDFRKEASIAEGGYGRKQIQELIQNAADALRNEKGQIEVHLTRSTLYVANGGQPFEDTGVQALLYSHLSNKTGEEIGRFGLGFKSMTGVSDGPKIYSQSVSFGFDRQKARQEIESEIGPLEIDEVPSLRLAWPLDAQEDFADDEILSDLAKKSVTVIKIPLKPGSFQGLFDELRQFDESFCLFVPHITKMRLSVPSEGFYRQFSASRRGKKVRLDNETGKSSEWFVFSTQHHPSSGALASAGSSAHREEITVSWAVPINTKVGIGQLCAYFPVQSKTTLSGRLNAPWKLSDDRINVIECLFNKEILEKVFPQLVVQARSVLAENDLRHYFDVLPARGREARSWADAVLNEPIYTALRNERSLPDATGTLRSPNSLLLLPEEVDEGLAEEWLERAHSFDQWVHPVCQDKDCRAKARRLIDNGRETGRIDAWLETFIDRDAKNPEDSINALSAAYNVVQNAKTENCIEIKNSAASADIVLLETGIWVRPDRQVCFIRTDKHGAVSNFVDSRVADDSRAWRALNEFGVKDFAEVGEIAPLLARIKETVNIDWEAAWMTFRQTEIRILKEGFKEDLRGRHRQIIKVLDARGEWVVPNGQYISGGLLQKTEKDAALFVDPQFHAADKAILELLGIWETPQLLPEFANQKWVGQFKKAVLPDMIDRLQLRTSDKERVEFGLPAAMYGPLDRFEEFSDSNKAKLTLFLLNRANTPDIEVKNSRNRLKARTIHPMFWLLNSKGCLKSSQGIVPISHCFVANDDELVLNLANIFPVVTDLDISRHVKEYLGFKTGIEELDSSDYSTCAYLHQLKDDESAVGKVYSYWCWQLVDAKPEKIYVKASGEWEYIAPEDIAVTADATHEANLESLGIPTLSVPTAEDVELLADNWGLMRSSEVPIEYESDGEAQAQYLVEVYPPLENLYCLGEDIDDLRLIVCSALEMVSAIPGRPKSRKSVAFGRKEDDIFVTAGDQRGQLEQILSALNVEPDAESLDTLEDELDELRNSSLDAQLRACDSDIERLELLFDEGDFLKLVPENALNVVRKQAGEAPTGRKLIDLCVSMYGSSLLQQLCEQKGEWLPIRGVPKTWNGSFSARKWVRERGFSEEWAGMPAPPRNAPSEIVEGPSDLPKFHSYQAHVSTRLRKMLSGKASKRRGLITLPTGAGKTRVAVQSIVTAISEGELDWAQPTGFHGPILWIADNEELCEQAIETWVYIWRALGRRDTPLTISRHFERFDANEVPDGVQIVVATWQKLKVNLNSSNYDWLRESPLVVIDEAHTALSRSFSEILEWTGRGTRERDRLLLGLTATPFRGRQDSEDTGRLRRRFDDNILDREAFGDVPPMQYLQDENVLAQVTMLQIQTDSFIQLTSKEEQEFRERHWLPAAKASELSADVVRTQRIVDSIKSLPSDWPIIVFAATVDNAETLATLLTLEGIPAAAISSSTRPAERKLAVSRFKKGELRVLTNFNVLSQGFDAPMTRAVYITRPTTSEVRYQQMIGRGLRGPKNGGTEKVLLVNVLDNIANFDLSIKYDTFEYLADNVIDSYDKVVRS